MNVKSSVLQTYAENGTSGLEEFMEVNMVAGYDSWLLRQADYYTSPCEPEIIRAEKAYEPDGYSMEYTYNCDECDNEECEYWKEHN